MLKRFALALSLVAAPLAAEEIDLTDAPCGGAFAAFKAGLVEEAVTLGHDRASAEAFLAGVRLEQSVLDADRRQGVFQRDFIDFSNRLIAQYRIDNGKYYAGQLDSLFYAIEASIRLKRDVLVECSASDNDFGQA